MSNILAVTIGFSHCTLSQPKVPLGSSGAGPAQAAASSVEGEDDWGLSRSCHLGFPSLMTTQHCCRVSMGAARHKHRPLDPSGKHLILLSPHSCVCRMALVGAFCQSPSCHQDTGSSWQSPQGLQALNIHHKETIPS